MSGSRWLVLAFALTFVLACGALRLADPPQVKLARELLFDEYQRIAPRPYRDLPVRIVDIDEASLSAIGQWPWPRNDLARLVDRLADLGAAAIAFDFVFPESDRMSPAALGRRSDVTSSLGEDLTRTIVSRLPDNDALFARSMEERNVVLGFGIVPGANDRRPQVKSGLAYTGENPVESLASFRGTTVNIPPLDAAAAGIGAISVSPQDDQGIVRQVPLLWSDGKKIYPGLALEALRAAQQAQTLLVRSTPTAPAAIVSVRVGDIEVPTTRAGELRIRFSHDVPERYIPALKLMGDKPDDSLRPLVENHIVLLGTSAVGLLDVRVTALGETVPGVMVHAQAIEQMILGEHLQRPDWVDPLELLWTAAFGLLIAGLGLFAGPAVALSAGLALFVATIAGSWIAFDRYGILLDPLYPALVGLALHFALTSFRFLVTDRDKRFVRRAFGRYVSPEVLAELEKNPQALRLGGEERELTILFLDVRSFTSLSETMTPTALVEFVNTLLSHLSDEIVAEAGTIDKYIGDSIMAFWNAPLAVPDHAVKACRACLRMRERMHLLNESDAFGFRARGHAKAVVRIGIGLNTGMACVGNVGSQTRFNYSVLGDAVNVGARVEGLCKDVGSDILVTETVVAAAPRFAWIEAGSVMLRGRAADTRIYCLVGDETVAGSERFASLKAAHDDLLAAWRTDDRDSWTRCRDRCMAIAEADFPMLLGLYQTPGPKLGKRREAAEAH
jgi:adenylate cyclase